MTTLTLSRDYGAPICTTENLEFWEGTAKKVLRIKHCEACNRPHWYPRTLCPFCLSDRTVWKDAVGTGTVYSFSVLRRGANAPYAIAYVQLDEGVTLLSNIVDCDLDTLSIGDTLKVTFKPFGSADTHYTLPLFTRA